MQNLFFSSIIHSHNFWIYNFNLVFLNTVEVRTLRKEWTSIWKFQIKEHTATYSFNTTKVHIINPYLLLAGLSEAKELEYQWNPCVDHNNQDSKFHNSIKINQSIVKAKILLLMTCTQPSQPYWTYTYYSA